MYLGIEIGGTKLQLGIGPGDGVIHALWRGVIVPADGAEGIRRQISQAIPELLTNAQQTRAQLQGVGIGFGTTVITSRPGSALRRDRVSRVSSESRSRRSIVERDTVRRRSASGFVMVGSRRRKCRKGPSAETGRGMREIWQAISIIKTNR